MTDRNTLLKMSDALERNAQNLLAHVQASFTTFVRDVQDFRDLVEQLPETPVPIAVDTRRLEELIGQLKTVNARDLLPAEMLIPSRLVPLPSATWTDVTVLQAPVSEPEPPAAPAYTWPPGKDDPFPTLEEYTALGFYADTYEHQRAAHAALSEPPTPEPGELAGGEVQYGEWSDTAQNLGETASAVPTPDDTPKPGDTTPADSAG